jgi:5-methylcytosine-specific restriction endonuclease McrA
MNELEHAKQLSDEALISKLSRCVREDRVLNARLLAHLGEMDDRGLYRDQGFNSMFDYCVRALHMSESEADLRIKSARIGRQFPNALEMLARGELHMTALRLLAPVLTASNTHLLKEVCFKSKQEVREVIAKHFPAPDVADSMRRLPQPRSTSLSHEPQPAVLSQLSSAIPVQPSAQLASSPHHPIQTSDAPLLVSSPHQPVQTSGAPLFASSPNHSAHASGSPLRTSVRSTFAVNKPAVIAPLSEGRYKVQFTASKSLHWKLKEARDLCCDEVPYGELARIVEQAIDLLIAHKKKQRFALTSRPRKEWLPRSGAHASSERREEDNVSKGPVGGMPHRPREAERSLAKHEANTPVDGPCEAEQSLAKPRESKSAERACDEKQTSAKREAGKSDSRYIPSALRRAVYARDGGQCSFVSTNGTRCGSRRDLEFDHIVPFARRGAMTLDNLRLMCRPHNALLAERDYGRDYVKNRVAKQQEKIGKLQNNRARSRQA